MIKLGKGMFIWKLKECSNDDPAVLAIEAVRAGFTWVAIKVQNTYKGIVSRYWYNKDRIGPAVMELKKRGIKVFGWGWVEGATPGGISIARREAKVAIDCDQEFDLDGFLINAERAYKRRNSYKWAGEYMDYLRHGIPDKPIGLCSYRFPSLHPGIPWNTFLKKCDFHNPQVYWVHAHNPADQLDRSIRELTALKDLPVIPIGPAYSEGGWAGPTVAEMNEFDARAQELDLIGVTWWSWQHAEKRSDWWDAIGAHDWGDVPPPPPIHKHIVTVAHPAEVEIVIHEELHYD